MFVDTHTHLQFNAYKDDYKHALDRALDANVAVVNVGTQKDTSKSAVELLSFYPDNVYAAVGLHPEHTWRHFHDEDEGFVTREEDFDYEYYKALALHPKVVGIGECGLDYYWFAKELREKSLTSEEVESLKQRQKDVFIKQLELAFELDKVLCIHCRATPGTQDAYDALIEIIKFHKDKNKMPRFEIHCFTTNLEYANKFIELGGLIGINGILTFDKSGVLEEVVRGVDLKNIILETDAPYLAPSPHRGKRNEPAYVIEVARKIAQIKNLSLEEVEKVTTDNARGLFKL